jgi:hypothetical protein
MPGVEIASGNSYMPHNPWKLLSERSLMYMRISAVKICITSLNFGDMSNTSSSAPTYAIVSIQPKITNREEHSVMTHEHTVPSIIPKRIAMPPKTGTGRICNLRVLGLSTIFFALANRTK